MSCSIQIKLITLTLILKSISSEIIFEDEFNDLNETKWEIISSETQCKSEFTLL